MPDKNKTNDEIGHVRPIKIEEEVQTSYLDYAMSVIVARALPDVRDGLKPVHRRILFAMHNLGLRHNVKYRKSATVVGEVLGKYHPHGDVAVYDSMVNMAQEFKQRYQLIDGQGNFGSIDGDPAAAMRYTESRMTEVAEELLTDIEKDTVDFVDNYDGTLKEPKVLPAKLPNLLINGTLGIAVGMATNMPPHNLTEVIDGTIHLIDNPQATVDDLMQFVKGPDFPTRAMIFNTDEIKLAYATGKGSVLMRAVAEIEEYKKGFRIIISELPYQVNKATLIEKIAELHKNKKINGISDLRDESDKDGIRIVVELKKDAYPKKILNQLYKYTVMQSAFNVNMLALIDGIEPKVLTLKTILSEYIKHRQQVVERRTAFNLDEAKKRAHILEGLKIALDNLDAVIKTIKQSKDKEVAKVNLMKKFKLSDVQAQAILEMRLQQLAALERKKIEDEYRDKLKLIKELQAILKSPKMILNIIKNELSEYKEKYGDARRTKIIKTKVSEFQEEDLIPNEDVIVTITKGNYIKRLSLSTYRTQKRGGKGIKGATPKEEDIVSNLFITKTHNDVLFFTNLGRVFQIKVYEIPSASRIAKGQAIVNLIQVSPEEHVTAVIPLDEKPDLSKFLVMGTKNGMVKKTSLKEFQNIRKSGLIAIRLKQDDQLKWIKVSAGKDEIFFATELGQSIRFSEKDARPMGRGTVGVRGIKLRKGDLVIGMGLIKDETRKIGEILVVTEKGLGKKTKIARYTLQHRGGIGLKTINLTAKTGKVCDMKIVKDPNADLVMVSQAGQIIRIPIKNIPSLGRSTQGVRLMRLNDNDKLSSVTGEISEDNGPKEEIGNMTENETKKESKEKTDKKIEKSVSKKKKTRSKNIQKKVKSKPKSKPKAKLKKKVKVQQKKKVTKKQTRTAKQKRPVKESKPKKSSKKGKT